MSCEALSNKIGRIMPETRAIIRLFFLLLIFTFMSVADVSLKNGNFYIAFTDVRYSGGFEPKIERVYNSKTSFKGIFGWGWGLEYEAYIALEGDGSAVVHEYGGGAENIFAPPSLNPRELADAIDSMVTHAAALDPQLSGVRRDNYKRRLAEDASFRNSEWDRLVAAGVIPPRRLPVGTILSSVRFSYQNIEKTATGYRRLFDNGRMEEFNEEGKLSKIVDKNSNWISLTYDEKRRLSTIIDNFGRKIQFRFNQQGLVRSVEDLQGKQVIYEYNQRSELVYSRGVDDQPTAYQYDELGRHNLVAIGYGDGTTMAIAYYPRQQYDNVWSVKDRDNTLTTYRYEQAQESISPSAYTVTTQVRGPSDDLISQSSYKYFRSTKADGEQWTSRLIATVDNDTTDTVYEESSGLPLSITRGKEATAFKYDGKGHVVRKETPTEIIRLKYKEAVGKVSFVETCSKPTLKTCSRSEFDYDDKGNLIYAKSEGNNGESAQDVNLEYDDHGRISTMSTGKRTIDFEYDTNSKPKLIALHGVGTIAVKYSVDGGIQSVDAVGENLSSDKKRKVSMEVTAVFQKLLDIIRPAGVDLSF